MHWPPSLSAGPDPARRRDDVVTATVERPIEEAAPDVPEQKLRPNPITKDGVASIIGAALGALGLVWVLYERILPTSGAFGFWLCWYAVFLASYYAIGRMQWDARLVTDRLVAIALSTAALLVVAFVVHEISYTLYRGEKAIEHSNFFTQNMSLTGPLDPLTSGGALHAMVGSLEQLGLATAFTVPLAVLTALFMSEIGGAAARLVRTVVDAMSAMPSVLAGLFILATVILSLGVGKSGFAASLAMTVMMLPIVTRAAEVVIRLVPGTLREASFALGASQWRTMWTVVLPTAKSGLTTAIVLGMARGIGETSPVLLTAGFTKEMNLNPFSGPQINMPLYIWNYVRFPQPNMVARAFGIGLTLVVVVLVLFITARILGGRPAGELTRRQRRRISRDARQSERVPA